MYTGRKFIAWLIATALCFGALGLRWITAEVWEHVFLGVTALFTVGNVASKFVTTPKKEE